MQEVDNMLTVNFGDYNSYADFNLILSSKTIGKAEPKTETVDIPGGDGVIDYTEYFGDIRYKNRKLTFNFSTIVPQSEFQSLFSTIQNALHGRKVKVWLDNEPDFYYFGRITVDDWKSNGRIGKITIEVDAEPWKYNQRLTSRSFDISTSAEIVLSNSRKQAVPSIVADVNMEVTFNGDIYNIVANVIYADPQITLSHGNNFFTVAGTGNIIFTWQEGSL